MVDFEGQLKSIQKNVMSNEYLATISFTDTSIISQLNDYSNTKLNIKIGKHRNHRSQDANALLWVCLGKIASTLNTDKWDVYLQMLKRYGKYTYICVKPNVVDAVKEQWRECEEIGKTTINGKEAVQMLCYFGSSTYNSKEFSTLLDGVISEMRELGLQTPTSQEMQRSLELWEKQSQS